MKTLFVKNLHRLKNALKFKNSFVLCFNIALTRNLFLFLWKEGFLLGIKKVSLKSANQSNTYEFLQVFLNYKASKNALHNIKIVSTPTRQIYAKWNHLAKFFQGNEIIIVSTPYGLLTHKECLALRCGGEVLCILS